MTGFFHSASLQVHPCCSVHRLRSFLWRNTVPSDDYTTCHLAIHSSMGIWLFPPLGYWIGVAMNKKMNICLNTCFRLNLFAKVRFSNLTGRSVCESPLSMSPFQFRQSSPGCKCHRKSLELKHSFLVFHLPRVWPCLLCMLEASLLAFSCPCCA